MIDTLYKNTDQSSSGTIWAADGTALDLTNKTVQLFIKEVDKPEILLFKSSESPDGNLNILLPKTGGQYTVNFVPNDTVNISEGTYQVGMIVIDSAKHIIYAGGDLIEIRAMGGPSE